jgi:hypothetical protein
MVEHGELQSLSDELAHILTKTFGVDPRIKTQTHQKSYGG